MFVFPYFFVGYIFTYKQKQKKKQKKSIFKVFKYYCLIDNVKKQFIEADIVKRGGRFLNWWLVIIS